MPREMQNIGNQKPHEQCYIISNSTSPIRAGIDSSYLALSLCLADVYESIRSSCRPGVTPYSASEKYSFSQTIPYYRGTLAKELEKFKFYVTVSFAAANHSGAVWELDLFGVDLVTVHVVHGNCAGMMLCRGALATTRTRTTS